jgi:hypothetical protein
MDGDPEVGAVPDEVRLQGVGDRRHDLERVRLHRGSDRRHGEREQAGVGTDVEEHVRVPRQRDHGVEGEPIVGLRPTPSTPVELLRVLAPSGVEHHERRAGDAAFHLLQVRGRRQASRAERRNEPRDEPEDRVREAEAQEPLDVALQAEPALSPAVRRPSGQSPVTASG